MNGIILAGGKNSRFGEDKAFAKMGDSTMVGSLISLLGPLFDKVIVVTNSPEKFREFPVKTVADAIRDIGPLGGIYSGLLASDQERNLVVACDMPSVKAELVQYLCSFNEGQAIVAKTNGLPQPLLGVYNRNCLSSIKEHIYRKDYKLSSLLQDIDTRYVEEDELKKIDPGLVSFRNINTKEEMYDQ